MTREVTARADRFTRHLAWDEIQRFDFGLRKGLGANTRNGTWVRLLGGPEGRRRREAPGIVGDIDVSTDDPVTGDTITYRIGRDATIADLSHPMSVLSFPRCDQPWTTM